MKILQVHNKYKQLGGEWAVLNQENKLLSVHHNVDQYIVDNAHELRSIISQLRLIGSTHYNKNSKSAVYSRIKSGGYEIMHVHNFFPLLTPSIFEASSRAGIPSVMTLHNFRLIHPNGLLYHKGKIDERSVNGSAWRCVMDGVYRDSILQTAVVAHMIEYHRKKKTWARYPSAFIALSEFSKQKFVEGGLPEERIFVKPNFIEDPLNRFDGLAVNQKKKNYYVYVGRISREKGVEKLIDYWLEKKPEPKLVIAGDGPLKTKLQKITAHREDIEWKGHLATEQVLSLLSFARAMLFPTEWYENFPITILEAMAVGCPVIATKIGNPGIIIKHGETGFHFEPGNLNDLHQQLDRLNNNGVMEKLSLNSRETYLEKYTPEKNYKILMDIYEQAAALEVELRKQM